MTGEEYVTSGKVKLEDFKDMLQRYSMFIKEKGREPNYVNIKPASDDTTGWVLTGYYLQDLQDTGYTCGPSSLQMALSALGCNIPEKTLMQWAGTTTAGTTYDGLKRAIAKAAQACNKNLFYHNLPFKGTGWEKIAQLLRQNCEIIVHIITLPGLDYDINGNRVWTQAWGHYIYLVGVNLDKKLVKIADPTKGVRTFKFEQLERAIANVTWGNSLHVICPQAGGV